MSNPIPPSIYARLAALESAVRDLRQRADAVDALGNQLRGHARAIHKTAGAISLDVWAARDALALGPMPDWATDDRGAGVVSPSLDHDWGPRLNSPIGVRCSLCFQIASQPHQDSPCLGRTVYGNAIAGDYDRDPGNVRHESIADRPQVVRDVPTPDGKPAVDPRIVPGCTVRIGRFARYDLRGNTYPVATVGPHYVEIRVPGNATCFVAHGDVAFAPPAATFAPDMAGDTFPDRMVGSPFAAADSTPNVTACMDVFDATDATPSDFWCPAFHLLYSFHTGDAASGCPICHGDLSREPSPSTISFADQAAAAMKDDAADDGEDSPSSSDTTSALLADFGYAVRNGGTR